MTFTTKVWVVGLIGRAENCFNHHKHCPDLRSEHHWCKMSFFFFPQAKFSCTVHVLLCRSSWLCQECACLRTPIAQSVERWAFGPKVVGSNPTGGQWHKFTASVVLPFVPLKN